MANTETKAAELLVLGVGQMRTGTLSLKTALEHLYGGKCYHMVSVLGNNKQIKLWQQSINNKKMTKETADQLFNGYIASVDFPGIAFYKDLLKLYPDAKVILTIRDVDSWLVSVRETTLEVDRHIFIVKILMYFLDYQPFTTMRDGLFKMTFNHPMAELYKDDILRAAYIKYNEDVKKCVPSGNLLIFEPREGWKPLCDFLGKPVPDIAYPCVNTTEDFRRRWKIRFAFLLIKALVPVAAVGAGIVYAKYYRK